LFTAAAVCLARIHPPVLSGRGILGSFWLDLEGAVSRVVDKPVTKLIKAAENISKSLLDIIDSKVDIVLNVTKNQSSDVIARFDSRAKSVTDLVNNTKADCNLAVHNATQMIETSAKGFLGEFKEFNSKVDTFNTKLDDFNSTIFLLAICIGAYCCLLAIEKVIGFILFFGQPGIIIIITHLLVR